MKEFRQHLITQQQINYSPSQSTYILFCVYQYMLKKKQTTMTFVGTVNEWQLDINIKKIRTTKAKESGSYFQKQISQHCTSVHLFSLNLEIVSVCKTIQGFYYSHFHHSLLVFICTQDLPYMLLMYKSSFTNESSPEHKLFPSKSLLEITL